MGRHDASGLIVAFQQHYRDLLRFLARRTGDAERAADIAQETYIRLNTIASEAGWVQNHKAYIYRIAGNLAIDAVRRETREARWLVSEAPDDLIADPTPSPERVVIDRDRLRLLEEALEALPTKARLALLMFRVDGLSHRQIAERLGVSESMVAKYIAHALRHCRDRLWQTD